MEKIKRISVLALLCVVCISAEAQKKTGIHQYLIRTTGSFAFGYGGKEWRYHIYGEAGFLLTDKTEFNGGINLGVGSSNPNSLDYFQGNKTGNINPGDYRWHGYWAGLKYHFLTDKNMDVYVGLQPGLAMVIAQPHFSEQLGNAGREMGIAPLVSECAGIAYYASVFHVYAELRMIQGKYNSPRYSLPLSEVRLSFGLGFNIN